MKVLQINTTVNTGSTGRIAEDIGKSLVVSRHKSYIAFGRGNQNSEAELIRIGNNKDILWHGVKSLLFDSQGLGSKKATRKLLKDIKDINPDVIHLHNLHGYYINFKILFEFFQELDLPIVWTLHDCWSYTGHCTHYENIACNKWMTECHECPKKNKYPRSLFLDKSKRNYNLKKEVFNAVDKMTLVVPSRWLAKDLKSSFLSRFRTNVIYNGIDINTFKSRIDSDAKKRQKIILGVASVWQESKGLNDFIKLSQYVGDEYKIVLVGTKKVYSNLNVTTIPRTESQEELAKLYSKALVFINPTYLDNFPNTNIEALACGTPVITYNTGGSPEAIDDDTGFVVEKGDMNGLVSAIEAISKNGKEYYSQKCRARAEKYFNKDDRYQDYIDLYESILSKDK